ncbi:MAG: hypothetical protein QF733_09640 [Phycisphaerales bacterium]|nr:hypothetical protein [Phycisphaerales bacterium]
MAAAPPGALSTLALLTLACLLVIIAAIVVMLMIHRRKVRPPRGDRGSGVDAWAEAGRRMPAPQQGTPDED